jgi:hypothetical protein
MSCVDKENDFNTANRLQSSAKAMGKPRFGSMLAEVRKEIQVENDNLMAIDCQADEVAGIVKEWVQENNDMHMAAELAKTLDEEEAANRRLEVLRGESEALKVAVEEKRRLRAEAEAKIQREKDDEAFAKKFVEDEEKEFQRSRASMMYADEKLCRQLSTDLDKKSGAKDGSPTNHDDERKEWDESEDEYEEEQEDEEHKADHDEDDSCHAERAIQQLEHDFELARHFQRQLDLEARAMKTQLEAKDEMYSRKLQVMEERKAFMGRKRAQLAGDYEKHCQQKNESYVASLWENAEADVDNVQNALCLTLLLPNITNVQVKLIYDQSNNGGKARFVLRKKNPIIRIEATRMVKDRLCAKSDNSVYVAEFQLDPNVGQKPSSSLFGGKKVGLKLSPRDIYFEYTSESGLLHVFVENILLNESVYSSDSSKAGPAPSSGSAKTPLSTAGSVKNLMLKQFQGGFLRVFGSNGVGDSNVNKSHK